MFGFPTDLFGIPSSNNNSRMNGNSLVPQHQALFGNSLMIPAPFMTSPFAGGGMNNLFEDFGINSSPFTMMDTMIRGGNNNSNAPMHSFTSTTVMSYNGTDGRPKVYQESTSHSRGPGGIEETRQAVRDSERGINKVQIGHRIGDRKHVVEREMNTETGQISENIELENLDEEETDGFKKEWRQRSAHAGLVRHPHHRYHHQIGSNRLYHPSSGSQQAPLAIEHTSSTESSNRQPQQQKSSKHLHNSSRRPQLHHSDTIDLTEDTPVEDDVEEIEQLPLPQTSSGKRKASSSSSNDAHTQRKHRQNRF